MRTDNVRKAPRQKAPTRRKPVVRRAPSRGPQGLPGRQGSVRTPKPIRPVYGPPTPKRLTPAVQQHIRVQTKKKIARKQAAKTQRMVNLQGDRPSDYRRGSAEAAKAIKQARIAHLRATRKQTQPGQIPGILRRAVTHELEGHGVLAHGLSALSKHVEIRPGGTKLASTSLGISDSTAAKLAPRIAKDAINFPAQVLPAVYVPAKAAFEAAKGNQKPGKQLLKGLNESDPFVNLAAAGVAALQGHSAKANARLKKAKRLAEKHPGFALLEGYGIKGSAGRGAGRAMRSGALGEKAKRAASTERKPRTVEGTALVEHRAYSKDVLRKVSQVRRERSRREEAQRLRETATKIEDRNPGRAQDLRRKAVRKDPDVMHAKDIRRRMDERLDANESVRRLDRARTRRNVERVVKPAKKAERGALALVTQNITTASKSDLRSYVSELAKQYDSLDRSGRAANKSLRRQIEGVIDGKGYDPANVRRVASEYEKLTKPLQEALVAHKLLDPAQAERATLIPYAVRRMGAKHEPAHWIDADGKRVPESEVRRVQSQDPTTARALYTEVPARLVSRTGKPLSTDAIKAHMRQNGVPDPAFLTQAPNMRGGKNFNIRSEQPQQIRTARRTGEATRKGTFDANPEVLVENAVKAQGLVSAVEGFKSMVGEFSVRGKDSRPITHKSKLEVDKVVNNLNAKEGGTKFRAIRVSPFGAKKELLDQVLDQPDVEQIKGFRDLIDEALDGKGTEGPWAIIPEAAADQLQAHLRSMGPGATAKAWQVFNSQFRQTVLATSIPWMVGNTVEATLRAALAKAGPRSYMTGKRVLDTARKMDAKAADEAMARTVGGGHFAFAKKSDVRRDATQFQDTYLEGTAQAMGKLRRTPGPKQVADVWNRYTDFVFNQLNGRLESNFQTAMLGKALRDSPLMDGQTMKLSQKAIDQAARGLLGTNEQVALGRAVDRMYGRYGKFSPTQKMMVAYYTPFIAWTLNAYRFVFDVLPRDHPTVTALIASAEQVSDSWRKDHGLDLFMNGAVPGWLQGTIPISGGRHLPASRYTPFGAFGDPLNTAGSAVLPQISGVLNIWKQNEDWKGTPIRKKNGQPGDIGDQLKATAQAIAESTIPALGLGQRIAAKGPAALNPFNPIAPGGSGSGEVIEPSSPHQLSRQEQLLHHRAQAGGVALSQDRMQELLRKRQEILKRARRP